MRRSTGNQSTSPVSGREPARTPPRASANRFSNARSSTRFTPRPAGTITSALVTSTSLRARCGGADAQARRRQIDSDLAKCALRALARRRPREAVGRHGGDHGVAGQHLARHEAAAVDPPLDGKVSLRIERHGDAIGGAGRLQPLRQTGCDLGAETGDELAGDLGRRFALEHHALARCRRGGDIDGIQARELRQAIRVGADEGARGELRGSACGPRPSPAEPSERAAG